MRLQRASSRWKILPDVPPSQVAVVPGTTIGGTCAIMSIESSGPTAGFTICDTRENGAKNGSVNFVSFLLASESVISSIFACVP